MDEVWQHGSLGQWIGWHSTWGCGQQGGIPCTLPMREHAVVASKITDFKNIFKRVSIIKKFNLQRKLKSNNEWYFFKNIYTYLYILIHISRNMSIYL